MKKLLLIVCLLPALHLFAGDSVSIDEMKFQLMQKQVDAQQQELEEKKNEIETLMQHHEDAMDRQLVIYTGIFLSVLGIASWLLNWLGKKEVRDIASEIANKKVEEELITKLSKDVIDKKIEAFAQPLIDAMIADANKEIDKALEGVKNKSKKFDEEFETAENKLKNLDPNASLTKEQMASVKKVEEKSVADIKSGDSTKAVVDYLYSKAVKARSNQDYSFALNYLNDILELEPNDALMLNNRGYTKIQLKKYEEAIIDLNSAIEIGPNLAVFYTNRGIAKLNLSKYEAAIDDLNKALEIENDYSIAFQKRSLAYVKLQRFEQALQDINKVIELNPDYKEAIELKAEIEKLTSEQNHN